MHELAVSKSILQLVLRHAQAGGAKKVLNVNLIVGEMRNIEESWMQRYFDYISVGTAAEKAVIKIRKVPVVFLCGDCGKKFTADIKDDKKILCPFCSSFHYDLDSGRELIIESVAVR